MVSVTVAADVVLYREGLAEILRHRPAVEVVGVAGDVQELVDQIHDPVPDVVLLDVDLVGALEAVPAIRAKAPTVRVVALAVSEASTRLVPWARAGVAAFVSRDGSLDELVETITATTHGEYVCSPRLTSRLLADLASAPPAADDAFGKSDARLTRREREIVRLLSMEKSNKEIAHHLSIAVPTVKNHVHHILEKLQVQRRSDAGPALAQAGVVAYQ